MIPKKTDSNGIDPSNAKPSVANSPDEELSTAESQSSSTFKRCRARYGAALFTIGLGVLAGIGTFTFGYGKGSSYLSNNPAGCANCHVMQDHFDSWQHSSHHHVAVCNDCHLPHNFVGKWETKAEDGFLHSLKFTLENYHEPIQIRPVNSRITQNTCLHCHEEFVHNLLPPAVDGNDPSARVQEAISCVHCHKNVGHAFRSP